MVFNVISAVAAVVALGLSALALYRQRSIARVEAHPVNVMPNHEVHVQVLNSGNRAARAPWFIISTQGKFVIGQAGAFLGPGKLAVVPTDLKSDGMLGRKNVDGVVGHIDPDGRHVVRYLWGDRSVTGRPRKFRSDTAFKSIFEAMYPDAEAGAQVGSYPGETID